MYSERYARVQSELQSRDLHCLALIPGTNLRYLTGIDFHLMERATIGFIPAQGEAVFVLPGLERARYERHAPFPTTVFSYEDGENPWTAVRDAIAALPEIHRLAVEYLSMRVHELNLIKRSLPNIQLFEGGEVMDALRTVKDVHEVAHLRKAMQISEQALEQVIGDAKVGMTEREIANALIIKQMEMGGGMMPFAPIALVGDNAASPHGEAGARTLEAGQVLLIDFGTSHEGYYSDITRTFVVGREPDQETRDAYEAVKAANEAGRKAAGPGVPCKEVDRAARDVIEQAGFGEYFIHRVGHGLGMAGHENPSVDAGNDTPLAEGNVFTVEPGVYLAGKFGIRIEDDVLITADGAESLTTFDRELRIIGA